MIRADTQRYVLTTPPGQITELVPDLNGLVIANAARCVHVQADAPTVPWVHKVTAHAIRYMLIHADTC